MDTHIHRKEKQINKGTDQLRVFVAVRSPWPSAQERLEERRRGGIWNLPPLPNASDAPSTTASSRNTLLTFSTVTTTSFPNAAPTNAPANGVSQTTTSFSRPGGYCNQVRHSAWTFAAPVPLQLRTFFIFSLFRYRFSLA